MKCDVCGAPVEHNICTYCGKTFIKDNKPVHSNEKPAVSVRNNVKKNVYTVHKDKRQSANPKKKSGCGTAIIVFIIICVIASIFNHSSDSSSETAEQSIWAEEITGIENFDYYLDEDYVYLTDYIGRDKKVWIGTSYEIEGKTYTVADTIDDLFCLHSVTSVILPDGLVSMPDNTFNSCGIKYVYIPASLQSDDSSYGFYRYFHDMEKIYYGGTKEQWAALTNNTERADIDVTEIIYEVSIEDLE